MAWAEATRPTSSCSTRTTSSTRSRELRRSRRADGRALRLGALRRRARRGRGRGLRRDLLADRASSASATPGWGSRARGSLGLPPGAGRARRVDPSGGARRRPPPARAATSSGRLPLPRGVHVKRKPLDETIEAFRAAEGERAAADPQGPGRAAGEERRRARPRRLALRPCATAGSSSSPTTCRPRSTCGCSPPPTSAWRRAAGRASGCTCTRRRRSASRS